jgi:hypothetical protein
VTRAPRDVSEASVERILHRVGTLSSFTEAQVRDIARIVLLAMQADEPARQRRDETARENRNRLGRMARGTRQPGREG